MQSFTILALAAAASASALPRQYTPHTYNGAVYNLAVASSYGEAPEYYFTFGDEFIANTTCSLTGGEIVQSNSCLGAASILTKPTTKCASENYEWDFSYQASTDETDPTGSWSLRVHNVEHDLFYCFIIRDEEECTRNSHGIPTRSDLRLAGIADAIRAGPTKNGACLRAN